MASVVDVALHPLKEDKTIETNDFQYLVVTRVHSAELNFILGCRFTKDHKEYLTIFGIIDWH